METQAEKCARLVTALEDLAAQEAATWQVGDFAEAALIQLRAAPLVDFIATAGLQAADSEFQARVATLLNLRRQSVERIAAEIRTVRAELQIMESRERTVARVAPAYGSRVDSARRQLCTRG